MNKFTILALLVLVSVGITATAQPIYQPYSFYSYDMLTSRLYGSDNKSHTAMKPYATGDSIISAPAFSQRHPDTLNRDWASRFYGRHQAEFERGKASLYTDLLPNFVMARDTKNKQDVWLTSMGLQAGGTISNKVSFQTSIFFNKARFAPYYRRYISRTAVIPGQHKQVTLLDGQSPAENTWTYFTGSVSYTPVKYVSIHTGYDKNFIGDGYRSLLLSDFASPHPFLRLTGTLGDVQYTAMWNALEDPSAPRFEKAVRKKGAVIHYLDWNITKKLSVGFFDAVVWATADSLGNKRGFDWGYASPIIFLRPVESDGGSPDNAVMGFTAKYKLFDKMALYGQFALDEFQSKSFFSSDGSSTNKWGVQLGVRGADPFKISGVNYLFEFNTVRPYTFSERVSVVNYAHYNEPLGHPYGANFRELLGILSYRLRRIELSTQLLYSRYGLDENGLNYGKDIFKKYTQPARSKGNYIAQGLGTDLYYTDTKVAYLLNAPYNLRLEAGVVTRNERNRQEKNVATIFTLGLRSSFQKLYQDF
ncbi:gliding motility protein RemB [Arcticibacter sp. MXS-1]|uniref:gliding motility protein RemB n=1 Tax=Arcticibacter sp. MXS-1 TaxID=3341726 RepID=UPI0035A88994